MKRISLHENGFGLVEGLIVIVVIGLVFLGGFYLDRSQNPKNSSLPKISSASFDLKSNANFSSSNQPTLNTSSQPATVGSGGEQLSTKGMTRPPQYLQVCATSSNIEYVTQGSPQCLGSDTYEGSYSSGVPGTLFSSPCETSSGTAAVRYVYISENESCPTGTTLVFYNTLCPTNASSSDDCTTPTSSEKTN